MKEAPSPPTADLPGWTSLLRGIRMRANTLDRTGDWPAEDLRLLADYGAMRWALPMEFGGVDLSALDLHLLYEALAAASLSTALILSQRDSAAGLIDGSECESLRRELLPGLAENEMFSTVGIAQLTTSRQGGRPAMRAIPTDSGFQIDGLIPWATGADQCDFIVSGAVIEGEMPRQILFIL